MARGRCGGYVLVGGQSSRMGSDKALLPLGRKTLLEHAASAVLEAVGSVVLIGDPARYAGQPFPIVPDLIPGYGPVSGIHTALTHAARSDKNIEWNLIVACDMPGLAAHPLCRILETIEAHSEADVLLPELEGQPQPLCAVYRTRLHSHMEVALRMGNLKVMSALAPLRLVRLPMRDYRLFENVNTPEEWATVSHR